MVSFAQGGTAASCVLVYSPAQKAAGNSEVRVTLDNVASAFPAAVDISREFYFYVTCLDLSERRARRTRRPGAVGTLRSPSGRTASWRRTFEGAPQMTRLQGFCIAVLALVWSGALPDDSHAQTASGRTVRVIVPFPPGGTADILARVVGEQIGKTGGPTILVENRPGGGTVIATEQVARAAPDGNTLLLMANSFVINAAVRPSLPYDPLTSFDPVCLMVDSPQILVVNATSPFRTLADFVSAAKAKPGELNYATVGPATTQHIAFEMFNRAAGIKLTYVPYGGGAPATTALVGGHVMAVLANPSEVMEQINAGRLRAIGVASRERFAPLPNVPTIAESYPGFEATAWFGLVTPARTPKPVIEQHITMFKTALAAPDVQAKLTPQGYRSIGACGEAFGAHIKAQHADYSRVTKEAGIKVE